MWIGVTPRFSRFHEALNVTEDQVQDAYKKQLGVRQSLERAYYDVSTTDPPGLIVGSWGKGTHRRPPKDVDVLFRMPDAVFARFDNLAEKKQSALLQEVKQKLQVTYPQTDMRGDGQVVIVRFNTLTIEVVPSFWRTDGKYVIPDTNNGGRWKIVDPIAEFETISDADKATNYNTRTLIKMIKCWKDHCNVPLKSYLIEILVAEFMLVYEFARQDYFYYDWFVRDFFIFLCGKLWGSVYSPGDHERVMLGYEWHSRAEIARDRAIRACEDERGDDTIAAGEEWQKIFGARIPIQVL